MDIFNDKKRVENLQVLLSFKIKKCKKENCQKKKNWIGQKKKCHRYHSDKDKRRFPFIMPVSILQNQKKLMEKLKNSLNYTLIDLFEELIELNPQVFNYSKIPMTYNNLHSEIFLNNNNCLNEVEYLYHPFNYKTQKCNLEKCDYQFCYYYHSKDEFLEFEDLRELFLECQDSVFSRYNRLNLDMVGSLAKLESRKKCYLAGRFPVFEEGQAERDVEKKELGDIEKLLEIDIDGVKGNEGNGDIKEQSIFNNGRNFNGFNGNFGFNQGFNGNNRNVNYNQNYGNLNNQNLNNNLLQKYELNNPQSQEEFIKRQKEFQQRKWRSSDANYNFFEDLEINVNKISKEMDKKTPTPDKTKPKSNLASPQKKRKRTYSIPKTLNNTPTKSEIKKEKKKTKRQTIKKGKFLCKYNDANAQDYFYNKEVQMYESITEEFKHFTKVDITTILNYICGYLNSYGGSIYFGINDDGIVKGIQMSRKEIDDFQINLDIALRNFMPKVFPDQIRVKFNEICLDAKGAYVILDRYVLQIDVFCINHNEIYITNEYNCYIKKYASLNHLSIEEIIILVKSRYNPFISSDNLPSRLNPLILERMSEEELKAVVRNMGGFLKMAKERLEIVENNK